MTSVKFKTVLTSLKKDEKPLSRFVVLHNGVVYDDTVYASVAQKSGQPKPLVKATGSMIFDEIGENLKRGYRVEFPQMSAFLSIPGLVESASAESLRASPPKLVAHFAAKGGFKKCCQGDEFVLVNVAQGASVGIDTVIDSVSETPDVLTNGTDVEVHVTGRGLYMPDLDDPTVGAYVAGSDGTVLAKATVTRSTATLLVCTFPEIDLEVGTYRLCVASRNGMDPAQYGVTVGRRNIRVVDAAPADEEEVQDGE